MRYAAIRPIDISNGKGIGVALFVQGCTIHCKGCFQPQTWDFNGGYEFNAAAKERLFKYLRQPGITRFSILGGEPLEECNWTTLASLIKEVKIEFPHLSIWLYSGYTYQAIVLSIIDHYEKTKDLEFIFYNIDVLVAGPFVEEEKDLGLKWRGSRNQKVINIPATVANNFVIVECDELE